jgi:hypothetical protein
MKRTVVMSRNSTKPVLSTPSAPKLTGWVHNRDTRRAINVIINDPHGFDIFTDGHWRLNGSGIDDIVQAKRPWELYTGAASVVLISRAPNWMEEGIVTIRIEHGELLETHSPY